MREDSLSAGEQQVPPRIRELRRLLAERKETVLLCMDYLREIPSLDFPLANKFISLENLAKREGIREAILILSLAISGPPSKIIKPKSKIKI